MKDNLTFAEKDLASLLQALQTPAPAKAGTSSPGNDMVVVITGQGLGRGSEHLGKILMKFFLQSLTASAAKPRMIILMSDGVLLACENAEVLGSLTVLQEQGTRILVDGTSVDYHQMEDKVRCGQVVSMLAICGEIIAAPRIAAF